MSEKFQDKYDKIDGILTKYKSYDSAFQTDKMSHELMDNDELGSRERLG